MQSQGSVAVREYVFGHFRVDLLAFQLWRDHQPVPLIPKAFDALALLIEHRDRVVTKDELIGWLWPDAAVTEDSLTHCISTLRKAVGDDTRNPRLIATVARRGYRFIAHIEEPVAAEPLVIPQPKRVGESFALGESVESPANTTPPVEFVQDSSVDAEVPRKERRFRDWKPWLGGALAGVICAIAPVLLLPRIFSPRHESRDQAPPLHLSVPSPAGVHITSGGMLSPNGRYLALLAQDDRSGSEEIWIRSLDTGQFRMIPGTDGASRPFWSPDSRQIGFFHGGKLKRFGIDDQVTQVITPTAATTSGAAWSSTGTILFAEARSGLYSVPASGGSSTLLTTLNLPEREVAHRYPQFLPDGDHFLYYAVSTKATRSGTYLGSLRSKQVERVLDVQAIYASQGYLVYTRDHLLMASAFDPSRPYAQQAPRVIGGTVFPAATINENISLASNLSVSSNGLLAYTSSAGMPQVKWFNRSGQEVARIDVPTAMHYPVLSPDQKLVLVGGVSTDRDPGLWLIDLSRGVSTLLVPDGMAPLWSPDGGRIAFAGDRQGRNGIFVKPITSAKNDALILSTQDPKVPNDWSPDGQSILFCDHSPATKMDLWVVSVFGDHKAKPYLQTSFNEMQGQISPDGRWIAYTSDESGVWEIYVQSFPEPGSKRTVSIGGGAEAHWRKDGKELFYLSPDGSLMAMDITPGPSPIIGRPHALFRAPVLPSSNVLRNQFAVSADGQRFLIGVLEKSMGEQISMLSSWPNLLSH